MATQVVTRRVAPPVVSSVREVNVAFPENLAALCASAMFAGISKRELMEIASCARMRTFARDELLYIQGQAVRNLIVLQSGSVKHTQLSPNGDEVLLRMSGMGEALNPQADPNTCNHSCSARAMEQCSAWIWEYNRLQQLLDRYPQLRQNISRVLASRLHELEERFREVATEKVARRLALVMIRLLKQVGKQTEFGIHLSLSREDLAQMTGTTLFTVSRLLSKWSEQGLVIPKREAVIVKDAEGLEDVDDEIS